MTGRKRRVGGGVSQMCKPSAKPIGLHLILHHLSLVEESGIFSVVVECVDIGKNISGEGGFLD